MDSIGVVIPAYNAEAYIGEALDSVAQQSRKPEQVIVVDDGSTDGTVACVRAWMARTGTRIDLIEQANRGPAAGRNLGIRHATTDLIALLDADDVFLPHHLELLSGAFRRPDPPILCFADGESFTSDGPLEASLITGTAVEAVPYEAQPDGLRVLQGSAYASLLRACYIPVGASVFQRRAAEAVGLFDEAFRGPEDREFYLRLSRTGQFACYPTVVFRKRVHGENLTHARHRATYRRYQLLVLRKMLRNAASLRLTRGELLETVAALREHAWNMLYHASERGLGSFLPTVGFLLRQGLVRPLLAPKHWVRAMAFSTVRAKRFR